MARASYLSAGSCLARDSNSKPRISFLTGEISGIAVSVSLKVLATRSVYKGVRCAVAEGFRETLGVSNSARPPQKKKFITTMHPYLTAHNKTAIYWEDVLLDDTVKVRLQIFPRERIYDCDISYGLSEEESKLVLGGEVALWSEQSDRTGMDG
jgi:hypothetical protein